MKVVKVKKGDDCINKKIIYLFLSFFYIATIFNVYTVNAYYENDYLIEDFDTLSSLPFYSYYQGNRWLNCTGGYNYQQSIKVKDSNNHASLKTENYSFNNYNITLNGDGLGNYEFQSFTFKDNDDNKLFEMRLTDEGLNTFFYLYDDDDNVVYNHIGAGNNGIDGWVNFSLYESNHTIHLVSEEESLNEWFETRNDLNLLGNSLHINIGNDDACKFSIDDVYCKLVTNQQQEYDIDYFKIGDELSNGGDTSTDNNDYVCLETDYKNNNNIPYDIKQVAIAVDSKTDFDDLAINCFINDNNIGSFDSRYTISDTTPDRIILVWEDIEIDNITEDIIFEFMISKTGSESFIGWVDSAYDKDIDADSEYKYSLDSSSKRNGLYDGTITTNRDLLYSFWYNSTFEGYGDLSDYEKVCSATPPTQYEDIVAKEQYLWSQIPTNTQYLEFQFNNKVSAYIEAVDLYIGNEQYELSSDLTTYHLYVNGNIASEPSYFIPTGDGNYILRWIDCNIAIENENPLFEFNCDVGEYRTYLLKTYYIHWVDVGTASKGERTTQINAHGTSSLYGNGELDSAIMTDYSDKQLSMCYYISSYVPNPEYDDTIIVQPLDKTQYQEYDVLTISGTISVLTPDTYIWLWKDGTQITTHGYANNGLFVKDYSFKEFFALNSKNYDGNWQIHLNRGGVNISTYNFTVIDRTDYNGHLYTYPMVSNVGEQFKIGYLYNKTYYDNNNGAVLYGRFPEFNPNYNVIFDNIQEDNEKDYTHNKEEIMYMFLCVKENGTYTPISSHVHYVGDYYTNEIHVNDKELYLTRDIQGTLIPANQVFYGYHSYTTSDVYIYDNGKKLKDISSTPNFNINYEYYSSGNHNISLVLDKGNGNVEILDTTSFIIYGESQEEQKFLGLLPLVIGYVLGLVLLMIVMIGLAIFSKDRNLHYSIYLIVGTSVTIFNVLIGAWEWWTILFFSTVIIAVVVMELSKKYGSNN